MANKANDKIPFWPSQNQAFGCLGLLLGALGGPCLLFLVFACVGWIRPETEEYGLFFTGLFLLLSVPLGAAAGTAIGFAIAEKMERNREQVSEGEDYLQ